MNREALIELISRVLLSHDIKDNHHTHCICEEQLWNEGKPGLARHRAERIADMIQQQT